MKIAQSKIFSLVFITMIIQFNLMNISAQVRSSLFDSYTVNDGLNDKTIHCVFQDSKGLIWIGTDFGVLRFEGTKFLKFDVSSKESNILSNALIRTIFESKDGIIWIGTENHGIFRYDRSVYKITQIQYNGLSNKSVWSIIQDIDDNLWLATEDGLNCFVPDSGKVVKVIRNQPGRKKILPSDFIRSLYYDKERGEIWMGTKNGIAVINHFNDKIKTYLVDKEGQGLVNEVWDIYRDRRGDLWIGTYLGGLMLYDKETDTFKEFILNKGHNRAKTVRCIVEDKEDNIWVGTRGGLYSIDRKSNEITIFEHDIFNDYSLIHNSILSLFLDRKGDLWIGTRNGISFLNFDRRAFGYLTAGYNNKVNLNNSEIYALWKDPYNKLWIGTESGGVNIYDRKKKTIQYLTSENVLSNNCIKAICPDNLGNVLIGTYLGGLNLYNPKTGRNRVFMHDLKNENSLSDNQVWSVFKDSRKRIWVGTTEGVDLYNEEKGTFENFGRQYEVGMVVMIFEDTKGRLWMYSEDLKKLTMVAPAGQIKHFPIKTRCMANDQNGNLWLGTLGNGLMRYDFDNDIEKVYTIENGLCSNVIYGIVAEGERYLWLSTNNGLSRFDIINEQFKNYYNGNGLLNNQFNYGASIKCSDSSLAFGGKKGVDYVFLDKLKENDYLPPVIITGFKIFNKAVKVDNQGKKSLLSNFISETKKVVVDYDQNMISFDFAALNYSNSIENNYKYKLEEFDEEWNEIGANHTATYTNLDPGEYVFRVIGTNSDNKYDADGVALELKVLPPFWKTWWFRWLIIIIIAALFYYIYVVIINREKLKHQLSYERKTARQLQELDRLKHQFFMNISHEIRTPLSLIIGPLDRLLSGKDLSEDSRLSHLKIIKRNTSILSKLVNQLLDYRKIETGNLKLELKKGNLCLFVNDIIESFRSMAEEKNISIEFNSIHKSIFTWFDSDKIEKIINNLLSNAVKYTNSGGRVIFSLSLVFNDEVDKSQSYLPPFDADEINEEQQFIKIVVRDTGIGIPSNQIIKIFDRFKQIDNKYRKSAPGTGIGLSLTKELVKLHKGHINVKSVEGKGSRFTILIPCDFSDLEKDMVIVEDNQGKETPQPKSLKKQGEEKVRNTIQNKNQPILLVIDDNPDIREFIRNHFEPEYIVNEAKDGKDGWDLALEIIPDIIVVDVMMPNIDGNELCKRIKKDERTSHIPVIMLTALTSKDKQLAGIDAGADDYITKPFDVAVLKAKADNTLYIRKALRERFSKELLLKPKDIILTSPDEKFLKRVIQVIEKNIAMPELDVDFLAKQVGVSRTQLYRKINALTDMAAKEFVKDIRLKRAAQLIVQDKLNISEISYEVGFSDISYFRKCFKEKYGMSASEYLKTHRV